jgi:hypothetical protein
MAMKLSKRTWLWPVDKQQDSYVRIDLDPSEIRFSLRGCHGRAVEIHSWLDSNPKKALVRRELRRFKVIRDHLNLLIDTVEEEYELNINKERG